MVNSDLVRQLNFDDPVDDFARRRAILYNIGKCVCVGAGGERNGMCTGEMGWSPPQSFTLEHHYF